jgi:hypothetical protein
MQQNLQPRRYLLHTRIPKRPSITNVPFVVEELALPSFYATGKTSTVTVHP